MTDDKNVQAAAPEETKVEAKPDPAPAASQDEKTDWKAELEKTQKELGQAKFTIQKLKSKKEPVKPEEHVDEEEEEEVPVKTIEATVVEHIDAIKSDLYGDVLDEEIAKLAADPDLRSLVKLHYQKSIRHSGANRAAIQADVMNAFAIANRTVLAKVSSEAAHAATADVSKGSGYAGSQRVDRTSDGLTAEDRATIASIARRTNVPIEKVTAHYIANR